MGSGIRVWGFGFGVKVLGFGVQGFWVWGFGIKRLRFTVSCCALIKGVPQAGTSFRGPREPHITQIPFYLLSVSPLGRVYAAGIYPPGGCP